MELILYVPEEIKEPLEREMEIELDDLDTTDEDDQERYNMLTCALGNLHESKCGELSVTNLEVLEELVYRLSRGYLKSRNKREKH